MTFILAALIAFVVYFQVKWIYEVFVEGSHEPIEPKVDLFFRSAITLVIVLCLLVFFPTATSDQRLSTSEYDYVKTEDMVMFVHEDTYEKVTDPYIHTFASDTTKIKVNEITLYGFTGHTIESFLIVEKR